MPLPPLSSNPQQGKNPANKKKSMLIELLLSQNHFPQSPKDMLPNSLLNCNSKSICWVSSLKSILLDPPVDLPHEMVPCGSLPFGSFYHTASCIRWVHFPCLIHRDKQDKGVLWSEILRSPCWSRAGGWGSTSPTHQRESKASAEGFAQGWRIHSKLEVECDPPSNQVFQKYNST